MAYPKAPDKKIQKLSNILTKYAESEGIEFSFGSGEDAQTVYPMEAFAFFGGLSLFLVEAKDLFEKTHNGLFTVQELMESIGKKIQAPTMDQVIDEQTFLENKKKEKLFPINFVEQKDNTYFGFIPRIPDDVPFDFIGVAHFAQYTVEEYIKIYKKNKNLMNEGRIPLDPLYDRMMLQINSQKIKVKPSASPDLPSA